MKRLLFIRGEPGSGKHTVGKLVADRLGWDYLWFHDLWRHDVSDPVLIAMTVLPGLAGRLATGRNLVFTRPAKLRSTVAEVVTLAGHCGYRPTVIRLTAPQATLVSRVSGRQPESWRVSNAAGLDKYLADGGHEPYEGEMVISTEGHGIEAVVEAVTSDLEP